MRLRIRTYDLMVFEDNRAGEDARLRIDIATMAAFAFYISGE